MHSIYGSADLVFAPTLAFTGFSEDLLLNYAMIAGYSSSPVYVGPFARSWHGLSTTDPNHICSAFYRTPDGFLLPPLARLSMKTDLAPASSKALLHASAVAPVV